MSGERARKSLADLVRPGELPGQGTPFRRWMEASQVLKFRQQEEARLRRQYQDAADRLREAHENYCRLAAACSAEWKREREHAHETTGQEIAR